MTFDTTIRAKRGQMSSDLPYAVIIDSDPGMSLSLRHLFHAICGESAETYPSAEAASELVSGPDWPKVFVLGRVARRPALIADLKGKGAPFVLVLDRGEFSDEGDEAFFHGADEVIQVPFSLRSLALRLRARIGLLNSDKGLEILRESQNWDSGAYIANHAGLTAAEAQIAHVLISHNGEIVSRDALSQAIDQRPWDYGDRKFDVHVAKIRKKLTVAFGDHVSVNTVRSAGYKLTIDEQGLQRLMG